MKVSDLPNRFTIAEYCPSLTGEATLRLVNGSIRVRLPYHFIYADGSVSDEILVDAEATEQQLAALLAGIAALLQATNEQIEALGWTTQR
jgi:hypothetical protein